MNPTQGPWRIVRQANRCFEIMAANDVLVAKVMIGDDMGTDREREPHIQEAFANAMLIVEASKGAEPEPIALLRWALEQWAAELDDNTGHALASSPRMDTDRAKLKRAFELTGYKEPSNG